MDDMLLYKSIYQPLANQYVHVDVDWQHGASKTNLVLRTFLRYRYEQYSLEGKNT